MEKNRIWIVPQNDLEAKTIIELLQKNGEDYLVTGQTWGASWDGLEENIKEQLSERKKKIIEEEIVPEDEYTMETTGRWNMEGDIPWYTIPEGALGKDHVVLERTGTREEYLMSPNTEEYTLPSAGHKRGSSGTLVRGKFQGYRETERTVLDTNIYGVELQGDSPYHNIDHHIYGDDDRSNPKSSIEQVADILGVKLTLDEKFVSANDKGYIPEMEKLGAELGMTEKELNEIITNIRMRDRQMQGVTLEQEAQAQEAVEALGEIDEKREYIQLDLPHSKTSTVTDRLYGKYDNLLIISGDGETNFYGKTEIIDLLNEKFPGGWSGGQLDQGSGFWGGYADQQAIKTEVQAYIDGKDKGKVKDENIK